MKHYSKLCIALSMLSGAVLAADNETVTLSGTFAPTPCTITSSGVVEIPPVNYDDLPATISTNITQPNAFTFEVSCSDSRDVHVQWRHVNQLGPAEVGQISNSSNGIPLVNDAGEYVARMTLRTSDSANLDYYKDEPGGYVFHRSHPSIIFYNNFAASEADRIEAMRVTATAGTPVTQALDAEIIYLKNRFDGGTSTLLSSQVQATIVF